MQVGKRTVETGGVKVETGIEEHEVNKNINLRSEQVDVDRRSVDRPVTESDLAAVKDGNFVVTERAEKAVVGKTARVVEEVTVEKDVIADTKNISDTVKRTEVEVKDLND